MPVERCSPNCHSSPQPSIHFLQIRKTHQLKFLSPFEKFLFENIDVSIGIFCEPNPKALSNIDPDRVRMASASRR
jgi:hypothetical protein